MILRPCYCFGGTFVMGGLICQKHLQQKDYQILRQKLHISTHPIFYWAVTFPKQQGYIPNGCWLNINLGSSSKALGRNEVSNVMLTRLSFEQSWPLGTTVSYKVHSLFKGRIHYSTLINWYHVGIDSYYQVSSFLFFFLTEQQEIWLWKKILILNVGN